MPDPVGETPAVDHTPLHACYDTVLFDLDGTVYRGSEPVPGAVETVRALRGREVAVRFVTNNASKGPEDVVAHLRAFGIDAEPAEVSTSAQAAATVLANHLSSGSAVLIVGAPALEAEVEAAGLRPVRKADDDVAAVVQGHWTETGWGDLAEACLAIRAGALWVAANVDATLPTERGELPGNGSMVAALRAATGAEPEVAGKPEAPLFTTAAASAGGRRALVVGDRLETDIAGAIAAGLDSLAVLTGVATPATLLAAPATARPRYLAADMSGLATPAEQSLIGPKPGWRVLAGDDALMVSANGSADRLQLLRALCHTAWETGVTAVRAADEQARSALVDLGLAR
ncbi:HAD-IIA family hydrolase [Amycolatopsis taiwanensis]|uniref:Acid sugar phosphatase n=1 Tax=Amycolatopsis taiwanensis TaxID=342230 RepID=A0A9W6VIY2_9PSEU|nr:HAD-IIA family hydrolase [Amycolatopsis taiwanensis]GLY70160.1 acid sugar phosphatase [Amycolatopsis taiwanensis]